MQEEDSEEKRTTNIGIDDIKVVICMDCDGDKPWVMILGELPPTQSLDQWVYWITNQSSGEEVPNIDWLISVFPDTNKNVELQTQRLSHGHSL